MGAMAYKGRALLLAVVLFALCVFILNADFNSEGKSNMLGSLVSITPGMRKRTDANGIMLLRA